MGSATAAIRRLVARTSRLLPHGWPDFLLQALVFWSFYVAYEGSRGLSDGSRDEAFAWATRVLDAERELGLDVELDIQGWALDAPGIVMDVANWTYFNCQFTVSYALMLWVYFRRNHAFYFSRNVLMLSSFIGLIGYNLLPTAPPRMFPELGFVDSLDQTAINHDTGLVAMFANPYAAMPSLHTAYALVIGITAISVCANPLVRVLWGLYPALVVFSIVATANHWLLDAVAGAGVACCAFLLSLALVRGELPARGRAPAGPLVLGRRRRLRAVPDAA